MSHIRNNPEMNYDYNGDLRSALKVLREGGVILYPTDTIWGIGCDATNEDAVARVFRIKKRNESKSLIVLVNGQVMLERYVVNVPETAASIIELSDKPITIIYPEGKNLAPGICSTDGSVGIRVCNERFCNELITNFRKPVVSTSANISAREAPGNFTGIDDYVINSVDYVVKYNQLDTEIKTPSSIIRFENNGVFKIIRP